MRLAFLVQKTTFEAPYLSPVTVEIIARLRATGADVTMLSPETTPLDLAALRPEYDLYVLKSKTPLALSLAGALTRLGARIVNTVQACVLARDKIAATAVLAACGLPVPISWATGHADRLQPMLESGPVWVKPYHGSRGAGVRRLSGPTDLNGVEDPLDPNGLPLPLFAQRAVPSTGHDLKVYVVGEQAWAIRRPFPAQTLSDKFGAPAALPPAIRAAALAVGRALGLELYGVDFLTSAGQFWVIDVNAFPGFKGVAEAPRYIAEYLHHRARRPEFQLNAIETPPPGERRLTSAQRLQVVTD
jgi:ribosomal protein S6--L-glutamate ligase